MKSKTTTILTLLLLFIWQVNSAQQRTISGAVTDENNIPLPGVNIIIKGTTTGTQSDFDGNFTISADDGQQIEFSYVGYQIQTITITQDVMSLTINMQLDAAELKEVVVTALGIKREKKALGYAITEIGSEGLAERPTGDLNKILMGKAAGVQVTNASGLSGAGGTVVIRSLASLGNNQPLYIVDGVRFNAEVGAGAGFFGTSRTFDMDPNNIENVTVLKGLSATALYGTDGKNGVIIITTKSGSATGGTKKTEITVHSSTFMNEISSLPNFTNERGQGYYDAFYNFFGNWGATFGRPNYGNVDALGQVPHPYFLNSTVFQSAFPEDTRADYKNYQSQENFFRTGVVTNTNVSVNGGTETTSFNMYISNLDDQGFMPGNNVRRTNFSVGGNA